MAKQKQKPLYLIPILSKALDIMEHLEAQSKPVSLEDIFQSLEVSKTSVYRVLKTLVHRGYVSQSSDGLYRLIPRPKKLRFGFAGQSAELPFSEAVTQSLRQAAASSGVELMIRDNRYDAQTALRNAESFIADKVDIIIEFQVEEEVAPQIAHMVGRAGIPLIAIDIPHPNATYFGVDNFTVGFEAGEMLARYALAAWRGKANWVLGLDLAEAGSFVQSRTTGAFEGIRSLLPKISQDRYVRMDGRGLRHISSKVVADFLRRRPREDSVLIAAATDTSAGCA